MIGDCERSLYYDVYDHLWWVEPAASSPVALVRHTYGADGQRSSTKTTRRDGTSSTQVWFTPDYTEHDGVRDHYFRVGDRLIARVTVQPPGGGATGAGLNTQGRATGGRGGDRGDLVAKVILALLLAAGLASVAAGLIGSKRRPAWISGTAGVVLLSLFGSCEMFGAGSTAARLVWEAVETIYFHQGVAAGPALMTTSAGTLFEERRYEPFGNPIDAYRPTGVAPIDPAREPQNSLGKMTDPATGFSYHGARWMMPETGRWATPDPAIMLPHPGQAAWDLNPYAYVRHSPIALWDPDGKQARGRARPTSGGSEPVFSVYEFPGRVDPRMEEWKERVEYIRTRRTTPENYRQNQGPGQFGPLVSGRTRLQPGDIDFMGSFNTRERNRDGLDGHELLPYSVLRAYLVARGLDAKLVDRRSPIWEIAGNPAIAIPREDHEKVTAEYNRLTRGLGDLSVSKTIILGRQALLNTRVVPVENVEILYREAVRHAEDIGAIPIQPPPPTIGGR